MRARPASLMALPVLALLILGACGSEEPPLTTREYADALEEAHATLQERLVEHGEAYEDVADEVKGRLDSLNTPWSEEDRESVEEVKETVLQALADVHAGILAISEDYHDAVSGLRPPEHLSDLHNAMADSLGQVLLRWGELVEKLKDRDSDPASGEDVDEVSNLASHADEACQELRAKLEAELGTDVAICD